jgi:hypothetical protein
VSRESCPDASSGAESGELPVRSKIAPSMDLVDRIGHLSSALSRLRRRASTSCYPADWGISPRLQGHLGIRHNDRQSPDLTAGVRASAPKSVLFGQHKATLISRDRARTYRRGSGRVFEQAAKGVLRVPRHQNAPSNLFLTGRALTTYQGRSHLAVARSWSHQRLPSWGTQFTCDVGCSLWCFPAAIAGTRRHPAGP